MKKAMTFVLTIALLALVIVSCSDSVEVEDRTSIVSFSTDEGLTRSLSRTDSGFDDRNYYWFYTAVKNDNTDLKTGETTTKKAVKLVSADDATPVKGLDDGDSTKYNVGPFSYGTWTFTLYGYTALATTPTTPDETKLAYMGSADVIIDEASTTLDVKVTAQEATGTTGTLKIAAYTTNGIQFKYGSNVSTLKKSDAEDGADYTIFENVTYENVSKKTAASTVNVPAANSDGLSINLATGIYKVTVKFQNKKYNPESTDFKNDLITYGEETIYVEIFGNQTTTISGSVDENTGEVNFTAADTNADKFLVVYLNKDDGSYLGSEWAANNTEVSKLTIYAASYIGRTLYVDGVEKKNTYEITNDTVITIEIAQGQGGGAGF